MVSTLKVDKIQNPSSGTTAMTIDTSGRVTQPAKPSFKAYKTGAWQSFGNTDHNVMPFNLTEFNIGTHYNTSTYKFTAPVTGVYYFKVQMLHDATNAGQVKLRKNGSDDLAFAEHGVQGETAETNVLVMLSATDYIEAMGRVGNTNADDWYANDNYSFFCGFLVG